MCYISSASDFRGGGGLLAIWKPFRPILAHFRPPSPILPTALAGEGGGLTHALSVGTTARLTFCPSCGEQSSPRTTTEQLSTGRASRRPPNGGGPGSVYSCNYVYAHSFRSAQCSVARRAAKFFKSNGSRTSLFVKPRPNLSRTAYVSYTKSKIIRPISLSQSTTVTYLDISKKR